MIWSLKVGGSVKAKKDNKATLCAYCSIVNQAVRTNKIAVDEARNERSRWMIVMPACPRPEIDANLKAD